ncbi:YigZ family protein [Ligilactobacillus cholophilus]|uniref:YigZ family protein n=1 Tax=Ligilactobacillus cholophilus TaxID=3050131 RepID=UPI0025B1A7CA|nr:YigZ family protein [Ligilactobacillus cholophilus]
MCKKNYFTIKKNGQYRQVIKKSEFICYINRIDSEHEAQNFIDQINKEHNKARHICYAYLLGLNDEIQRESDNGKVIMESPLARLAFLFLML